MVFVKFSSQTAEIAGRGVGWGGLQRKVLLFRHIVKVFIVHPSCTAHIILGEQLHLLHSQK